MTNYWMQAFPMPKAVIKHTETKCRVFLWTGRQMESRKAPIAWEHLCDSKVEGGLNIIALREWNRATTLKLLWNVAMKEDKLWVRWIHSFYLKGTDWFDFCPGQSASWIVKNMFKNQEERDQNEGWKEAIRTGNFCTKKVYKCLRGDKKRVGWYKLLYGNIARPRAMFILWMGCQYRLFTKDRMLRFGGQTDGTCAFCSNQETMEHLFFECPTTSKVWAALLKWLKLQHKPQKWEHELAWILRSSKGKSMKSKLLKATCAEAVYAIWCQRNRVVFGEQTEIDMSLHKQIIQVVRARITQNSKLQRYCLSL